VICFTGKFIQINQAAGLGSSLNHSIGREQA